jgi:hypoxanthine phosphoribosyltransferase
MPEFIPVLQKKDIESKIAEVSRKISDEYQGRELVMIGVLKGAFVFFADLMRQIRLEKIQVDFLRTASYGSGTLSSEKICLTKDIDLNIEGKDVLVVEDIVDTGLTLAFIIDHLRKSNPRSVKVCAMIDKRERRQTNIRVDYACHVAEEGFLVGYGLDHAEYFRNLPELYQIKF